MTRRPIDLRRHARSLCNVALAALMLVVLASCAAPPAAADSAAVSAVSANDATAPVEAPRTSSPLPPEEADTSSAVDTPLRIDASCKVDADCVVKDVGNCCGAYPACVNAGSPTDPAAVQAACKASGRMAACGFREIAACSCDQGTCRAQSGPVGGWINGSQPEPAR